MNNIWHKPYTLEEVNSIFAKYMTGYLDIQATEIGTDLLVATMPVNDKTKQPFGILHGGASVVLAESVGSVASNMIIDTDKYMGVGLDINANHVKSASDGLVTATCTPLHLGATTHVWDIKIKNGINQLVCVSRLTVAIIPKR
ncbi:hotdog fold thioesterase [Sphingobacterium sp. SYP-B4668]|uniref:hotdog fold thioesterase n=1 Tax=Sphingobacterium sp. SYP-B4668 TaxID=2996035 RepID=UPI0022DDFC74|nr:hotdog fold thioesterase [Sphingobacterium sp. SYP-B4668]